MSLWKVMCFHQFVASCAVKEKNAGDLLSRGKIIYHYWWVFGSQTIPPAQRMWAKGTESVVVGLENEVSSPNQWVLQRGMASLKLSCVLRCFAPINFSSENLSCESVLCLGKRQAGNSLDFPVDVSAFKSVKCACWECRESRQNSGRSSKENSYPALQEMMQISSTKMNFCFICWAVEFWEASSPFPSNGNSLLFLCKSQSVLTDFTVEEKLIWDIILLTSYPSWFAVLSSRAIWNG